MASDRRAGNTVLEQTLNELHDLAARLREKVAILDGMARADAVSLHEQIRLSGKADGVRLALSFVEEIIR